MAARTALLLAQPTLLIPALVMALPYGLASCREIPDEDAKKPEGWLDEEPAEIDDPGGWPAQGW